MRIFALLLTITLLQTGAQAANPPKPTTLDEVTKSVQSLYQALRRKNDKIGDQAATDKALADATAAIDKAKAAFKAVTDEEGKLTTQVEQLTEAAKERPKPLPNETNEAFGTRLDVHLDAKDKLPEKKKELETQQKASERLHKELKKTEAELAKATADAAKQKAITEANIEEKFKTLQLHNTVQSLGLDALDHGQKLDLLVQHLDNAILGAYMQDKLEGLLKSQQLCDAVANGCGKQGAPAQKLDGLFNGKSTHSK